MTGVDSAPRRASALVCATVAGWLVAIGAFVIVGADCLWAVALGDRVRASGDLTPSPDFAAAPVAHGWESPLALGEVILSLAHSVGSRGLVGLQLLVVGMVLSLTAAGARRVGGSAGRTALVVSLVVVGGLPALVVTRLPLFSLLLFPILAAVLRRQYAHPSAGIWWVVALLALWANLHGGVLVGAALVLVHLAFGRLRVRPLESVGVAVAALVALCATPAGASTVGYYLGVFGNEAARRGSDLWARPDPRHPLDALLTVAALVLLVLVARRRPPLWELVVLVGLVGGTALAARNGIWLLLFAAPAAVRPVTDERVLRPSYAADRRGWRPSPLPVVTGVVTAGLCVALVSTRDTAGVQAASAVPEIRALAAGRTVLATEPAAETLAQGGVRIWASNPIDAFTQPVQAAYLDFLGTGNIGPVVSGLGLVVAQTGSPAAKGLADNHAWHKVSVVAGYDVYEPAG